MPTPGPAVSGDDAAAGRLRDHSARLNARQRGTEQFHVDEENAAKRPSYPLQSVDNALRLLLMLRDSRELRLSDASEALGVVRSTAHRILAMLAYHGLVEQDPETKIYRAGPALIDLGLSVITQIDVREAARRHLEALAAEVEETTHLIILQGRNAVFLDSVEGPKVLRTTSRTGMSLPAHCVSGGKAMLADMPLGELRQLYPSGRLPQLTASSLTRRSDLERQLEAARERGYAVNFGESEEGIGAIGASICQPDGRPRAALVVAGPLSRVSEASAETIGAAVLRAARSVAAQVAGSQHGGES